MARPQRSPRPPVRRLSAQDKRMLLAVGVQPEHNVLAHRLEFYLNSRGWRGEVSEPQHGSTTAKIRFHHRETPFDIGDPYGGAGRALRRMAAECIAAAKRIEAAGKKGGGR